MDILIFFLIVGIAGVGSQWLSWRLQVPAIVLMLLAGLFVGPVTGIIHPSSAMGDLLQPIIAIAVAFILFEGGLTLDFSALKDGKQAVKRLVYIAGPLVWGLSTFAGLYIAGLSLASASIFGGILIVTGPTVIIPLLRQARLKKRPSEILRWESIVNDPVGALAAVIAYEIVLVSMNHHSSADVFGQLISGLLIASFVGYFTAEFVIKSFNHGYVPEYLKVPVLIAAVLFAYILPDLFLHESGLLAVTIMGIWIGNAHLPSLGEIRRFKEHITVILVSGVFILLAANLQFSLLAALDWRDYLFVGVIIFAVRPISVIIALTKTNIPFTERLFIGWIGPRGVVAVAVSGLFGLRLAEIGVVDGQKLPALAFLIVTATVFLHGFSIKPLAAALNLQSTSKQGILMVGANRFSLALAKKLHELEIPVLLADRNWYNLRDARLQNLPLYYGEILSEAAEHSINHHIYSEFMALSNNDDYNALICANFAPEFGRFHVHQFAVHHSVPENHALPQTLGGRYFGDKLTYEDAHSLLDENWKLTTTSLSENFSYEDYSAHNPDARIILAVREQGGFSTYRHDTPFTPQKGDKIIALTPPSQSA